MNTPIRVTIILHNIDRSIQFEHLIEAHKGKVAYTFILIQSQKGYISDYLMKQGIPFTEINYHSKKDILPALWKTITALRRYKPQIVHTHLFISGLVGSIAAWLVGIKNRVYTRHHSDFHWVNFLGMVKYDRLIAYLNNKIIAISPIVADILIHKEGIHTSKVITIPHGFQLGFWQEISSVQLELLKQKYNPKGLAPVIGVVARLTEWKGLQYILPAFKRLLNDFPDGLLILANAKGEFDIKPYLAEIPSRNIIIIEFEQNISHLFKMMDIFVHVPTTLTAEAFGQVYIEACASGLPSIFTLSGIAPYFIKHEHNALVVDYQDNNAIHEAMKRLLKDKTLTERLAKNAVLSVERYNFQTFSDRIFELYRSLIGGQD